jgi:hypothetical protein
MNGQHRRLPQSYMPIARTAAAAAVPAFRAAAFRWWL